jgi:hypothetical protein
MSSKPVTRTVSKESFEFSIWDNFNGIPGSTLLPGHKHVLREMGATDAEIEELRLAAVEVDEATKGASAIAAAADHDAAAAALEPVDIGLAEPLQPATKALRHWMATAVRKISAGRPDDGDGFFHCIASALHVALLWQAGRKDAAMRLVTAAGELAEAIPGILERFAGVDPDRAVTGYMRLMGMTGAIGKKKASDLYLAKLQSLSAQIAARRSPSGPDAAHGLASPGASTGTEPQRA